MESRLVDGNRKLLNVQIAVQRLGSVSRAGLQSLHILTSPSDRDTITYVAMTTSYIRPLSTAGVYWTSG